MKNLESHGILNRQFPGLEKFWKNKWPHNVLSRNFIVKNVYEPCNMHNKNIIFFAVWATECMICFWIWSKQGFLADSIILHSTFWTWLCACDAWSKASAPTDQSNLFLSRLLSVGSSIGESNEGTEAIPSSPQHRHGCHHRPVRDPGHAGIPALQRRHQSKHHA